jgi:hypothetical protein
MESAEERRQRRVRAAKRRIRELGVSDADLERAVGQVIAALEREGDDEGASWLREALDLVLAEHAEATDEELATELASREARDAFERQARQLAEVPEEGRLTEEQMQRYVAARETLWRARVRRQTGQDPLPPDAPAERRANLRRVRKAAAIDEQVRRRAAELWRAKRRENDGQR